MKEFIVVNDDCKIPDSVLYRVKRGEPETGFLVMKIGNLFELNLDTSISNCKYFASGYRSGMAQIARTSYNMPKFKKHKMGMRERGYRFAWLCHMYSLMHGGPDFPEIEMVLK